MPDPSRSDVVLATHEAAANAIEHAASRTPIEIRARLATATVAAEITDHGRWKDASRPDAAASEFEQRGRGLQLIEGLVTAVRIETDGDGTTLRLLKQI